MYRKFIIWTIAILPLFVYFSCQSALFMPSLWDAEQTHIPFDSLMRGRNLYIDNCSNCHNLYRPQEYTQDEWLDVFPKMKRKAKISSHQAELIQDYLFVHCKKP
jgi:hypothetical protein